MVQTLDRPSFQALMDGTYTLVFWVDGQQFTQEFSSLREALSYASRQEFQSQAGHFSTERIYFPSGSCPCSLAEWQDLVRLWWSHR